MKAPTSNKENLSFAQQFQKLSKPKRLQVLDFMSYLETKSEWDETMEILKEKKTMSGIKRGLAQIKRGEVSKVEF